MLSYFSAAKYQKLSVMAREERKKVSHRIYALCLVIYYNIMGFGDVVSTHFALISGNGVEANPLMRAVMEQGPIDSFWIILKLALQVLVTLMVLYYPNKVVLSIFTLCTVFFTFIVYNNFVIAGIL